MVSDFLLPDLSLSDKVGFIIVTESQNLFLRIPKRVPERFSSLMSKLAP